MGTVSVLRPLRVPARVASEDAPDLPRDPVQANRHGKLISPLRRPLRIIGIANLNVAFAESAEGMMMGRKFGFPGEKSSDPLAALDDYAQAHPEDPRKDPSTLRLFYNEGSVACQWRGHTIANFFPR